MVDRLIRERSGPRNFQKVVVVGPLGRRNGVARGAALQWAALRGAGADVQLIDGSAGLRNPLRRLGHKAGSVYVVHSGGPQLANLLATVLPNAATGYRIAYLAWELPDPCPEWAGCERFFDEVWTPSTFCRQSLAKLIDRPIHVVPHYVMPQLTHKRDPARPFTVLTMADSRSSLSRKNPEGALRAFRMAFGDSPRARLILKLNGRDPELDAFERSCDDLSGMRNVEFLRGYLDDSSLAQLYRKADVLLSLHRAEGFGLPMLEAMANGIPVIATGWSGNMDFMSPSDSELVPFRLVPVQDRAGVYSRSMWADPDIEAAAKSLLRLSDDHEHYNHLATAAYRRVADTPPKFPFTFQDLALTS